MHRQNSWYRGMIGIGERQVFDMRMNDIEFMKHFLINPTEHHHRNDDGRMILYSKTKSFTDRSNKSRACYGVCRCKEGGIMAPLNQPFR